jgi:methylglyoxal synthase
MIEMTKNKRKHIAILSQQHKKVELINWCYDNQDLLKQHHLYAASATSGILEGTMNAFIYMLPETASGIIKLMEEGKIDLVVFFWEPATANPHELNFSMLIEKAITLNIPFACNISTANVVISTLNPKNQQQESTENPVFRRRSAQENLVEANLFHAVTKN